MRGSCPSCRAPNGADLPHCCCYPHITHTSTSPGSLQVPSPSAFPALPEQPFCSPRKPHAKVPGFWGGTRPSEERGPMGTEAHASPVHFLGRQGRTGSAAPTQLLRLVVASYPFVFVFLSLCLSTYLSGQFLSVCLFLGSSLLQALASTHSLPYCYP